MKLNPAVIDEIRRMFQDGATPSRLIRHIVERHPGGANYYSLIQEYFREGFDVPLVRGLVPYDTYRHSDLRYAFLAQQLLHTMVVYSTEDQEVKEGSEDRSWLAGLTPSREEAGYPRAITSPLRELDSCWDTLPPDAQAAIQCLVASGTRSWEEVNILTRLVERLQQRVNELEAAVPTEEDAGIGAK